MSESRTRDLIGETKLEGEGQAHAWFCAACGSHLPGRKRRRTVFRCPECGTRLTGFFYSGTVPTSAEIEQTLRRKKSNQLRGMSHTPRPGSVVVVPEIKTGPEQRSPDVIDVLKWFSIDLCECVKSAQASTILRYSANGPRPWLRSVETCVEILQPRLLSENDSRLQREIRLRLKTAAQKREQILSRWRLSWWEDVCSELRAKKISPLLVPSFADYLAGYTLSRELMKSPPKRFNMFFRRLTKNALGRWPIRASTHKETLRTKLLRLMTSDIQNEPTMTHLKINKILTDIFSLVGDKLSPESTARIVRRSRRRNGHA